MKPFHVVVLGVFLALALVSVAVFALFRAGEGTHVGEVIMWGAFSESVMGGITGALSAENHDFNSIRYVAYSPEQLMPALVDAIARGAPPDLVLFPAEELLTHANKLVTIPYEQFSRRSFQDTFVEASEVFLGADGFKGYPFVIDPLVMYWNRSIFSSAGIVRPPTYWDELPDIAAKLTKKDERGGITQSAVALGSWDNVFHAKAIFASLLYQLGNRIVVFGRDGFQSVLASTVTNGVSTGESVLRFYTEFGDPVKPSYSWNRAHPSSRDAFIAGTLGIYFGTASELAGIRAANPNLNFDVAPFPATRGAGNGNYATLLVLAIPNGQVKNIQGGLLVAQALSGQSMQKKLAEFIILPSVRRDTLSASPNNPYIQTFNNASLAAFSFLDPSPKDSNMIFKRMIESILSGQLRIGEAVRIADAELEALLH